ncbi:MAG: hypothetical protein HN919_17975 [Verrucomicrobia bacterium]|jgi:hypothetical protein|nr:hypothetical protein [Verrucomicrobiota bacterium]MBT7068189.1 hypothetical protein [Verrucomicrobiota bacterium]MBT7701867.1 hypothetical protein [Verrucomicrobiota bacterium]
MNTQDTNWLSSKDFARRIGASVHFVQKRLNAGDVPYRYTAGHRGRLINRCHVRTFKPYSGNTKLFSVEDVIDRTGLLKQTICDLLKKREIHYTCSDGCGHYTVRSVPLDAARPIKRWVIPEDTMQALLDAVQPNRDQWPTAEDVARRIGSSTAYVLRLFETGRVRGQQSIVRQRVHIHPAAAEHLEHEGEYIISIGHVSSVTGLAVQSIAEIVRRGYFTQRHTDGSHTVVTEQIRIAAHKRLNRHWFSKQGMEALVQGVAPHLAHWPTAVAIEQRLDLRPGTVSRYFNNGYVRGCTSIKGQGQRLHVHPSSLKAFVLQKHYNVSIVAKRLGITVPTLNRWDREAPVPFLQHGLGRHNWLAPHLAGRMRFLKEHNALNRRSIRIIHGSYAAFRQAVQKMLFNTLYYNPDRPPSIGECKEGMRVIFPDDKAGLIRCTKPYVYRPAIEVFRPDEEATFTYAVAK